VVDHGGALLKDGAVAPMRDLAPRSRLVWPASDDAKAGAFSQLAGLGLVVLASGSRAQLQLPAKDCPDRLGRPHFLTMLLTRPMPTQ